MAGKYYAFRACVRSLLNATAFLFLNSVLITFYLLREHAVSWAIAIPTIRRRMLKGKERVSWLNWRIFPEVSTSCTSLILLMMPA